MSFVQANLRAQLNVTMEPKDWRAVAPKLDARGCRLETRENALGRDPISYQTLLDLSREDRDAPAMLEDSPSICRATYLRSPAIVKCFKNPESFGRESSMMRKLQDAGRNKRGFESVRASLRYQCLLEDGPNRYFITVQEDRGTCWGETTCESSEALCLQISSFLETLSLLHSRGFAHLDIAECHCVFNGHNAITMLDYEQAAFLKKDWKHPLQHCWEGPSDLKGEWPETSGTADGSERRALFGHGALFDPRAADVWSAGCMLRDTLAKKLERFPLPGFDKLIERMTAERPNDRPTAAQADAEFDQIVLDARSQRSHESANPLASSSNLDSRLERLTTGESTSSWSINPEQTAPRAPAVQERDTPEISAATPLLPSETAAEPESELEQLIELETSGPSPSSGLSAKEPDPASRAPSRAQSSGNPSGSGETGQALGHGSSESSLANPFAISSSLAVNPGSEPAGPPGGWVELPGERRMGPWKKFKRATAKWGAAAARRSGVQRD